VREAVLVQEPCEKGCLKTGGNLPESPSSNAAEQKLLGIEEFHGIAVGRTVDELQNLGDAGQLISVQIINQGQ